MLQTQSAHALKPSDGDDGDDGDDDDDDDFKTQVCCKTQSRQALKPSGSFLLTRPW